MGKFIGIDLGTTFSVVAHVDETGRPVIIPDQYSGDTNLTPSVVAWVKGEEHVGYAAKRTLGDDTTTFGHFKRDMGYREEKTKKEKTHTADGKSYTPTTLSAAVLTRLRKNAEKALGSLDGAVVTVPANFAEEARQDTMAAAKLAGLNVKHIINEPTAAALYYCSQSGLELAGKYAVYDLGGGTFDITIIEIANQEVEVLATDGVSRLGGDDFDEAIRTLVTAKYKSATGGVLDPEDYRKGDAEEDKISLSSRDECATTVRGSNGRATVELSRAEFEEAIALDITKTKILCENAMEAAGVVTPDELKGVLLAGGSTRIPCVLKSIEKMFGQQPIGTSNVDEVVALGAALYAIHKAPNDQLNPLQARTAGALKLVEAASYNYGTIILGGTSATGERKLENTTVISRGAKIPCSFTKSLATVDADQRVLECRVTQGKSEETDPEYVHEIWSGEFALPAGRPAGQEIKVTFKYDENGMMHCSWLDVAAGKTKDVSLAVSTASDPTEADIDKFTVD